jgi:hypothetical protein
MGEHGKRGAQVYRTERGLSITGTRITLYDVMDYLVQDWPPKLIRDWLNLSDDQLAVALEYIDANRSEFEAEYRQVLDDAEEERRYWEDRNRERFAAIARMPPNPAYVEFHAKVAASKARQQTSS